MKSFTDTLVYGLALGLGFKIGWDLIGWLLGQLATIVR
jgi:hypothetical protein